jgi:hypothetical protein
MKGKRPGEIRSRLPRGREGLRKGRRRYEPQGGAGRASGSPRPHHSPPESRREARAVGVKLRRNLMRRCGGVAAHGPCGKRSAERGCYARSLLPRLSSEG